MIRELAMQEEMAIWGGACFDSGGNMPTGPGDCMGGGRGSLGNGGSWHYGGGSGGSGGNGGVPQGVNWPQTAINAALAITVSGGTIAVNQALNNPPQSSTPPASNGGGGGPPQYYQP